MYSKTRLSLTRPDNTSRNRELSSWSVFYCSVSNTFKVSIRYSFSSSTPENHVSNIKESKPSWIFWLLLPFNCSNTSLSMLKLPSPVIGIIRNFVSEFPFLFSLTHVILHMLFWKKNLLLSLYLAGLVRHKASRNCLYLRFSMGLEVQSTASGFLMYKRQAWLNGALFFTLYFKNNAYILPYILLRCSVFLAFIWTCLFQLLLF